jgi:DNA-binding response OmpR family regulator
MRLRRKILIMDGDADLRTILANHIGSHSEFEVAQASNASDAILNLKEFIPDLVIIDVDLPDMDGRDVVQLIRQEGHQGPIIILSAYSIDAVTGLGGSADDYVLKPFKLNVIFTRIRYHLRNYDASEAAELIIGDCVFKPISKLLIRAAGSKCRLTEKETAVLKFLYRANAVVVTREVLLRELWGYNSSVTTHTLETHIYRLRQKIELDPADAQILVSEGGGYKLIP